MSNFTGEVVWVPGPRFMGTLPRVVVSSLQHAIALVLRRML